MPAAIGLLEFELIIPGSTSLKEKRKVLNALKDRMKSRMNVSYAEVDHQELHARSHIAVVSIAAGRRTVDERFAKIEQLLDTTPAIQLIGLERQWL